MGPKRAAPGVDDRAPRALPMDFLMRVFDVMEPSQLGICCLVCSDWHRSITSSSSLWRRVARRQLAFYRLVREEAAVHTASGGPQHGGSGAAAPPSGSGEAPPTAALRPDAGRQANPSREGAVAQGKRPAPPPAPGRGSVGAEHGGLAESSQRAWAVDVEHTRRLRQGPVAVQVLRGHSGRVNCCRMLAGTVVSGSADQTVKLWSAASGRCLSTWRAPTAAPISDVEFDDLKVMAAADAGIVIWSRATGRLLRRIDKLYTRVRALSYDGDTQLAAACDDGSVRIVDVYSGQSSHMFRPHTAAATCAALAAESGLLASGGSDGAVQLNDMNSGSKACLLQPRPTEGVTALHLMLDGYRLAAGTVAGNLYLWDLRNMQSPLKSKLFSHALTSVHAASYGPSTIVATGLAGSLHVLDAATCRPVRTLERPEPSAGWSDRAPARVLEAANADSSHSDASQLPRLVKLVSGDASQKPYLAPISCVRLGMSRAVTSHADNTVTIWRFGLPQVKIG